MPKARDKSNNQVTISKFFKFKPSSNKPKPKPKVDSKAKGLPKRSDNDISVAEDATDCDDKKRSKNNGTVAKTVSHSAKRRHVDDSGTSKRQKTNSADKVNGENDAPTCAADAVSPALTVTLCEDTQQKLGTFTHDAECPRLAAPISIADLKRLEAHHLTAEYAHMRLERHDGVDGEADNEAPENLQNEAASAIKSKLSKFGSVPTKGGVKPKSKYTPLEQQFIELKDKYPDAILFVECGYKYRFFGSDAEIAAKELNIFAHPDHSFMTASIPVHRLHVHLRRLVAKGYKVGVVKQTETAALKAAGDNRGAPFSRRLSALYTKTTLIGEDVDPVCSVDRDALQTQGSRAHLLCIYEPDLTSRNKSHQIAIVSVQPSTGEVIYDEFVDMATRSELEMRVAHIGPAELLLPRSLTPATEKVVRQLTAFSCRTDDRLRLERLDNDKFEPAQAYKGVSEFYGSAPSLAPMLQLPKTVLSCIHALITYLKDFNLQNVLKVSSNVRRFSTLEDRMLLPATSVRNLEVFANQTDGGVRGSLFWALDRTTSRFGGRLLRQWVARPLLQVSAIEARLDAVTELLTTTDPAITSLRTILTHLPDLEKGLCTILHKRCSTQEFVTVCSALVSVREAVLPHRAALSAQLKSTLLSDLSADLPDLLDGASEWVQALDEKAAREGDKANLFTDLTCYPEVLKCKSQIEAVLSGLEEHRKQIAKVLGLISFSYRSIMGTEFLIDVKNKDVKLVPKDWIKVNGTKATCRFHSPFILSSCRQLSRLREKLVIVSAEAWNQFLESFEEDYPRYRQAVGHLATLDCLLALATVARQEGFCRPTFTSGAGSEITVVAGRHPVVDLLLGETAQYVPNNTNLEASGRRCAVVTGPNMGGKSSYIKQVALLTIMAQVGAYVPAEGARFGVVDAVFTRMGACDDLLSGRSTLMVELEEAGEVMGLASPRSLVILDELGRGTSTHDGVAIACATLRYFVEQVKCMTLFVTHYPPITEFARLYPDHVTNHHMSFLINDPDGQEVDSEAAECSESASRPAWITFLYQLVPGEAGRSYGLNVARLAGLPTNIINEAAFKAKVLEHKVTRSRSERELFLQLWKADPENVSSILHKSATSDT